MRSGLTQGNQEYAVAYCEAGFAIYPLRPGTKIPAVPSPHPVDSAQRGRCRGECGQLGHGFYDARTDIGWAAEYWTEHPDHGIAARPAPGLLVLDIDPRHGGNDALAAWERSHGALPETFTTISGRGDGGHHRWFSGVAEPVHGQLCRGVDIITHSRGGVVMPPSLHPVSMQPYSFQTPLADIAPVPSWLAEIVSRPTARPRPSRRGRRMSPIEVRRRGRGLVAAVAGASRGERHRILYWAASRAAEDGLLDEGRGGLDIALAEAARDAGLALDEIERTIGDAITAAHARDGYC